MPVRQLNLKKPVRPSDSEHALSSCALNFPIYFACTHFLFPTMIMQKRTWKAWLWSNHRFDIRGGCALHVYDVMQPLQKTAHVHASLLQYLNPLPPHTHTHQCLMHVDLVKLNRPFKLRLTPGLQNISILYKMSMLKRNPLMKGEITPCNRV